MSESTSQLPGSHEPRRHLRPVLAAVVGLFAAVALIASAEDNEPSLVESDQGQQETETGNGDDNGANDGADSDGDGPTERFGVGDTVAIGDWQVRVNSVVDPWVSPEEFDTAASGRYVNVDVTVINSSDRPETVSSLACFTLRDADGRSIPSALVIGGGTAPDGEVDPGGQITGNLYYDVPDVATGLELRFQCDFFSRGSAVIAL